MSHFWREQERYSRGLLIAVAILSVFAATVASAGEAILSWSNAPGIAGSQIAIGSCQGLVYGLDVSGDYIRLPADAVEARIYRLQQGETFCFRIRHFNAAGVLGSWVFLGSKKIPLDSVAQPPLLPVPGDPSNGKVQ